MNHAANGRTNRKALCSLALVLVAALMAVLAPQALASASWGITLSDNPTILPRTDERMVYTAKVTNTGDAPTAGLATVRIELPGGPETTVFRVRQPSSSPGIDISGFNPPTGWTCAVQQPQGLVHASVTCARSDALSLGASYPEIVVVTHLSESSEDPGIATAEVSGGGVPIPASAQSQYEFEPGPGSPFNIIPGSFSAAVRDSLGNDYKVAGGHPFLAYTTFGFTTKRIVDNEVAPSGHIKDTVVDAARGFVGNALAAPELCPEIESVILGTCPPRSAVGGIDIFSVIGNQMDPPYPNVSAFPNDPIYSVQPEYGQPAQFSFGIKTGEVAYTFVPEVRADEGYAIRFRTAPIIMSPLLYGANVTLCSFGAGTVPGSVFSFTATLFTGCKEATDGDANPHPLTTNPTRCSGILAAGLKIDSWEHPEEVKTAEYTLPTPEGCDEVPFEPEAELQPTNHEADTPTGLDVEFNMDTSGLLSNTGVSEANLDNATVTFPKGMSINPAAASGLSSCSLAQVKLHSNAPDECPESSKVGTIEIDTPIIRETLRGNIYVAKQHENPFDAPFGLYMVFDSARDGIRIKVAGKLEADPVTGQLVSTFTENPEAPFSRLVLHFNQGPRSPLVNPPKCGTYAIHSEFSPWSAVNPANPTPDEIVSQDSTYEVTSGPNGSPCPVPNLEPKLSAGVQNAQAGSKSPFVFSLSREDGTQRFDKVTIDTPPGLTAALKGIPYCTDAQLGSISGAEEAGRLELANPQCPAASQVGTSEAGAGSGPFPYYAKGRVYLAGPYKGAPVSLAVVTPAVAGPYDLGNVVVRNPLYVDPVTSQVRTESDQIPTIIHGVLLDVRDVRVNLDRHPFTQAPTNCNQMSVNASVHGEEGANADLSNRFQVGGCEKLGYEPKLGFRLFGGTHRGSHPRLQATLTMPEGGANNASASVALPHSEFLDQAHIKTVCTRVQFAADQCPAGSIYGEAEATTPLLGYPVKGPAILRSSDHQLPDLVLALKGPDSQPIEIDLAGRIDSIHGGIRTTFEAIPDQPVSSFVLRMQGGKKGLLVNSRDICAGKTPKATGVFNAQNGLSKTLRPKMRSACKAPAKKTKRHNKRHSH